MKNKFSLFFISFVVFTLQADQPVMNMMPRWDDAWGFQVIEEYRYENELLLGKNKISNGLNEDVHITHLEAVYTWDKSIRLTAKLPYVIQAKREVLAQNGRNTTQQNEGFGDMTLALVLKKYFNLDGRTGSWTFAPQVRIPLAGESDYEIYDNQWGNGLFLGYETEVYRWFISTGASVWWYYGDEPAEAQLNLDLGWNITLDDSSGQILWESDMQFEDDDSRTFMAGPAVYWNINDTMHARIEWKHDFYDYQGSLDHGRGGSIKIGLGWVY